MSFQAMAWAVKQRPAGTKEKFVLLMLANYASNEDGDCHPSLTEICEATMLSRHSVIRSLKSLEDDGFLTVKRQRVGKVNVANSYRLNLQRVVPHSNQDSSAGVEGGSATQQLEVVPQVHPNLLEEPIKAAPRAREDLADKLLDAAGVRGNPSPSLAFPGPIIALQQQGYDLEADILPAMRSKPNPGLRSWQWYVPIVVEFVAKRQAIPARPAPPSADWGARVEAWRVDGTWIHAWGPKPNEPGFRGPANLKAQVAA